MVSTTRKDLASGEPSAFAAPRRISMAGDAASRSPRTVFLGMVNVSCTPSPAWWPERSVIAVGMGGEGATGSPGAPQPARKNKRPKIEIRASKRGLRRNSSLRLRSLQNKQEMTCGKGAAVTMSSNGIRVEAGHEFRVSIFEFRCLQNVAAQILILDDFGELLVHVCRIDLHIFLFQVRRFKR